MIKYIISLFIISISLLAQEMPISIDREIAEIKSASPSERVTLMNAFKEKLMQMNQEQRAAAIESMQQKMHSSVEHDSHQQSHTHTREMQMQHNENIVHSQNINQHQAGDQASRGKIVKDGSHIEMNGRIKHNR